MLGCEEDTKKPSGESPESNQTSAAPTDVMPDQVAKINVDDNETLDNILAGAIDWDKFQKGGTEHLYYAPNEQTPYTGWAKEMHDNGQIRALGQMKDGKKEGLATEWYWNGQKEWEVNYKDGKWDGLSTVWYRNGQKRLARNYKDGKLDGLSTEWYENGQKRLAINYKDGKPDGIYRDWYNNGQKKWENTYKNGKLEGLRTKWYFSGQKMHELIYKEGKLVTAVAWKINGGKCPHTKVMNGNGIVVEYSKTEYSSRKGEIWFEFYKDGEFVEDSRGPTAPPP